MKTYRDILIEASALSMRHTKKSKKRDIGQKKSLGAAEDKSIKLSKENPGKPVFMYSKDGEWIVTLNDPKITGMIKPKRFIDGKMEM
jgi:hypothetical protein